MGTTATVVVAEVADAALIRAREGDRAAAAHVLRLEELVREAASLHHGCVKRLGEAVAALFWSPRDGVACAAAIQRAAAPAHVPVRAGVATGEVTVADDDFFGPAVARAATLAMAAAPREIGVAAETASLAGSVAGATITERDGRHVVEWEPPPPAATPIVGRDADLALLVERVDAAGRGAGSAVLVSGDAGIGKTRLVEELAARVPAGAVTVLVGRCHEAVRLPYAPFVEVHEAAARVVQDYRAVLGDEGAALATIAPELRRIFPDLPSGPEVGDEHSRRYLFNSVAAVLRRAADRDAVVLVLEDLHWADEASVLLLEHLATSVGSMRVLVVATYRDTDVEGTSLGDALPRLLRLDAVSGLGLGPLDADSVRAIVRATSPAAADDAVEAICAATGGNPLFALETARHMEARGFTGSDDDVPLATTVRAVLERRLEGVSSESRAVLAAAAVLGQRIRAAAVARIASVDVATVGDAIDEAVAAHLVCRDDGGHAFAHDLVRQALLALVPTRERWELHVRAAQLAAERLRAGSGSAAAVAHHLLEAGPLGGEDVAERVADAAEEALRSGAYEDALRHLDRALVARPDSLPRQWAHLRGSALRGLGRFDEALPLWYEAFEQYVADDDAAAAARVGWDIAYELAWRKRWDEGALVVDRALALVGGGPVAERALLLSAKAVGAARVGDPVASGFIEEARAIAEEAGDPKTRGRVLLASKAVASLLGRREDAVATGEAAVETLREAGLLWELVGALDELVGAYLVVRRYGDARRHLRELERLSELTGNRFNELTHRRWAVELAHHERPCFEDYAAVMREVAERRRGERRPDTLADDLWRLGVALHAMGRVDEAVTVLEEGNEVDPRGPLCTATIAFALASQGTIDRRLPMLVRTARSDPRSVRISTVPELVDALAVLERQHDLASLAPELGPRIAKRGGAAAARAAAVLAAAAGDWDEAHQRFAGALERATTLPERDEEPMCHLLYGMTMLLWGVETDRDAAVRSLETAARLIAELGMHGFEPVTRSLLERARAARPVAAGLRRGRFRREGDYWVIALGGDQTRLRDARGLRHLHRLLAEPGREVHAIELAGAPEAPVGTATADTGPALDAVAKAAYRARLRDLQEEVDDASAANDLARAERAQEEIDFLVAELSAAVGLGGRDRKTGSNAERARLSVTKAIRASLDKVGADVPAVARHLERSVRTGTFCSYDPGDDEIAWEL